jgi:hypothetical protein
MKWALDQADEEGVEAYLEASEEGVGLYRKLGFKEVGSVEVDLGEGKEMYGNLCMLRRGGRR